MVIIPFEASKSCGVNALFF